MKHEYSAKLWQEASKLFPGGVNSPVRAFRGVGGTPFFTARAHGCRLWDVDGNEYIDYVGSWGPMILGHAHPKIVRAVQEAARNGDIETPRAALSSFEAEVARLKESLRSALETS